MVAITATQGDESRNVALNAGMDDFLFKPLSDEQLTSTMTKWVNYVAPPKKKKRVKVVTETGEVASVGGSEARRSVVSLHDLVEAVIARRKSEESRHASISESTQERAVLTEPDSGQASPSTETRSIRSTRQLSAQIPDPIPESSEISGHSRGPGSIAPDNLALENVAGGENETKAMADQAPTHTVTKAEPKASFNFPSNMNFSPNAGAPSSEEKSQEASGTRTPTSLRKKSSRKSMKSRRRSSIAPSHGSMEITSDDPGSEIDKGFVTSLHRRMKETLDEKGDVANGGRGNGEGTRTLKDSYSKRGSQTAGETPYRRLPTSEHKDAEDSDSSLNWRRKYSLASEEGKSRRASQHHHDKSQVTAEDVQHESERKESIDSEEEEYDFPLLF